MKKSKKRAAAAVIIVLLITAAAAALLIARPRLAYMAAETFSKISTQTKLKETECKTETVAVSELSERGIEIDDTLMLVNTDHMLPENYQPDLINYKDTDVIMERHTAQAYAELSEDIGEQFNEGLFVTSTYRTFEEQQQVLEEEGGDTAQQPGASEHETGLAADICFNGYAGMGVLDCKAGRYLNSNCQEHGFIIRYPLGKKNITGIEYEPWHIRYVGKPHAQIISGLDITLEEYINMLEVGKFYKYKDYIFSHQQGDELMLPLNVKTLSVSHDGCGGYIITAQK